MKKSSEDFVRSVKEKVSQQKNIEIIQRNLLHDSLDYFSSLINNDDEVEIRSQKKFESGELTCFLNLYSEVDDIPNLMKSIFDLAGLEYKMLDLDTKKIIYCVNFGQHILSSPHDNNWVFVELYLKGKHIFECRIFYRFGPIDYSLYENKYFNIKFWIFDGISFSKHEMPLINVSRNRRGIRRDLDGNYTAYIKFDRVGEVESIKISKKREQNRITKL